MNFLIGLGEAGDVFGKTFFGGRRFPWMKKVLKIHAVKHQ